MIGLFFRIVYIVPVIANIAVAERREHRICKENPINIISIGQIGKYTTSGYSAKLYLSHISVSVCLFLCVNKTLNTFFGVFFGFFLFVVETISYIRTIICKTLITTNTYTQYHISKNNNNSNVKPTVWFMDV